MFKAIRRISLYEPGISVIQVVIDSISFWNHIHVRDSVNVIVSSSNSQRRF